MFAVALWVSALTALVGARVYDRCELARDLQLLGVEREHIATWVCIAFHESRFDTAAQNYGSGDHGLLQISELYWCGPGKACGAPCSAFRDEDISDDVKCALQIHKEHTRLQGDGFLAWVVYPHHCKQNAKKYIIDCDKNAKNFPVKFENKARYLKPTDIRPEPKTQIVNVPYRNSQSPRYLAINSIFQGSYVDEFERNYYDNNKQSNWLYFKVDNIDDLKLPGADATRSRFTELTTRPTTKIPLDPALKGIKPPSPKRIETNQFRRRKTFAEPLFLRNRIADDQKIIRTTPVSVREETVSKFSFNEDLSHNIFLNLSPRIISTSLREFSPQERQSTDFNKFHVKTPRVESSSPNSILTYDDLAQNPFLNSLPGFNFKYRVDSPFLVTESSQKVRYTSPSPVSLVTNSKQVKLLPEQDSKIQENAEIKVSIEDLSKNPFLGHLLRANIGPLSTESQRPLNRGENLRRGFTLTTLKPIISTRKENLESGNIRLETSTIIPIGSVERGRTRFLSDFDKNPTETPTTVRSTTVAYSTRKYQTISRQKSNMNTNDFKSTTPIEQNTEKSDISSTVKPTDNNYRRQFSIESTTYKSTTLYNEAKDNAFGLINAGIPQTRSQQTTRGPETAKINSISRIQTTSRPQITNNIKTISTTSKSTSQTTSIPEISSASSTTSRPEPPSTQKKTQKSDTVISISRLESTSGQTTIRPEITSAARRTSRPWNTIGQETTQRPETAKQNSFNRLQTTSRPQTTGKPEITSAPLKTSKPWKTIRQQTTQRPETVKQNSLSRLQTTSGPQTTGRLEITKAQLTTSRPWKSIGQQTTQRPETAKINFVNILQTTSRPKSTGRLEIMNAPLATRRPWKTIIVQQPTQRPETAKLNSKSILQTTSRPQNDRRPEIMISPLTTSRTWKTTGEQTTQRSEIAKSNSKNILQTTSRPQTNGRPEITSSPLTTSRPWKTIGQQTTQRLESDKPYSISILQSTNRLQTTGRPEITTALMTTNRPYKTIGQQTTQGPETAKPNSKSILQTASRPQTDGRPEVTSSPLTTNRTLKTIGEQTTQRPEIAKSNSKSILKATSRPQTNGRPEATISPLTTRRPWKTIGEQTTQRPKIPKSNSKSILQATNRPQTEGGPEVTSSPLITSRPWKTIGQQTTQRPETGKSRSISRLQTTSTTVTTSRSAITSVPLTTSRPGIPIRQQTTKSTEMAKTNYISRIQITSRPQTTIGLPTTSRPQVTSRLDASSKPEINNNRVQTTSNATTIGPQTSIPWITSTPKTTSSTTISRSTNRFGEESGTSTTSQPGSSWRKYTNSIISPSTAYTTTIKPTIVSTTEASKGKTTQSIFDLYLKPSTRPSFKPFEFTTSINRPSKLSIFSGGTTKSHPDYFTTKKPFT